MINRVLLTAFAYSTRYFSLRPSANAGLRISCSFLSNTIRGHREITRFVHYVRIAAAIGPEDESLVTTHQPFATWLQYMPLMRAYGATWHVPVSFPSPLLCFLYHIAAWQRQIVPSSNLTPSLLSTVKQLSPWLCFSCWA